jgi:hypothetical protein
MLTHGSTERLRAPIAGINYHCRIAAVAILVIMRAIIIVVLIYISIAIYV